MKFNIVDRSSDFISECGIFKLGSCEKDFNDAYWTLMQVEGSTYSRISNIHMSFEEAKAVCEGYNDRLK